MSQWTAHLGNGGRSVAHVRDELHIRGTFSVMRKFNCITSPMQSTGIAYVLPAYFVVHIFRYTCWQRAPTSISLNITNVSERNRLQKS